MKNYQHVQTTQRGYEYIARECEQADGWNMEVDAEYENKIQQVGNIDQKPPKWIDEMKKYSRLNKNFSQRPH